MYNNLAASDVGYLVITASPLIKGKYYLAGCWPVCSTRWFHDQPPNPQAIFIELDYLSTRQIPYLQVEILHTFWGNFSLAVVDGSLKLLPVNL